MSSAPFVYKPGPRNAITDIDGLLIGQAVDEHAATGVSVLRCSARYNAAVDVRGGGPGTRETDALAPENLVGGVDAIVFSGGSVFGLGAADTVTSQLSSNKVGLKLSPNSPAIPIVPACVLHDLGNDGDKNWGNQPPYGALGRAALSNVGQGVELGRKGAGRGAMAGTIKGGVGTASLTLPGDVIVAAFVVANPVGSAIMADGKTPYAWALEQDGEFGNPRAPMQKDTAAPIPDLSRLSARLKPGANTTLAVVATNADLSRAECKRFAMMAHDGLARAVRPAHTPFDGDIVFGLATGAALIAGDALIARPSLLAQIGAAGADCLARSIARAVYEANK